MRRHLILPLLTLIALGPVHAQDHATSENPIINGRPVTPDERFSTVAIIDLFEGGQVCTGTLIAPALVVTAAHCVVVQDEQTDEIIEEFTPDSIAVYAGGPDANSAPDAELYDVDQIIRHASYPDPGPDSEEPSGIGEANDIALLLLFDDVTEVPPVKILPFEDFDAQVPTNANLIISGYGQREDVEGSDQAGELFIAETPFRFRNDTEFVAGGPGTPDTCPGDSGGPAYVFGTDDALYVIGASSRADELGEALCGDGGVYTLLPAYEDWIVRESGGRYELASVIGDPGPSTSEEDEDDCGCSTLTTPARSRGPSAPLLLSLLGLGLVAARRRGER